MTDARSDAELVRDHLTGDRSALAAMFDRYGPSLYDTAAAMTGDRHDAADLLQDVFVTAAERLGQLRDHDRLKPWLFAVLRNEVYKRTRRRSRVRPTDFGSPEVPEMAAPIDHQADGELAAYTELAELVRAAATGLDERDQLMLELSVRQGLQGADLAAAMGVSPEQSYTLVHRMRERVERSLGALVVARAGRRDCPELASILSGWDGQFTILVRKRVSRHVDSCDTCTRTRTKAAPIALFGAAPVLAMPAGLRDRVLTAASGVGSGASGSRMPDGGRAGSAFDAPGGFPGLVRTGSRFAGWISAAAAVLFIAVGAAVVLQATRQSEVSLTATTDAAITTVSAAPTSSAAASTTTTENPGPTTSAPRATTTTSPGTSTTTVAATVPPTTTGPVVIPTTGAPTTAAPTTAAPTTVPTTTAAPTTTRAPTPGRLEVSATSIDLGARSTSATINISNTGETPVRWGLRGSGGVFGVSASPGSLPGGASTVIAITFDRSAATEGSHTATLTITGNGGTTVTIRGSVERPPTVSAPKLVLSAAAAGVDAQGRATDESGVASVVITWSGPQSGSMQAQFDGDSYGAFLQVSKPGRYTVTATATDTRGNSASASNTITVP